MMFKVDFLEEARGFLLSLDEKASEKIIYNIDKSSRTLDSELFKKVDDDIREFRTFYNGIQ